MPSKKSLAALFFKERIPTKKGIEAKISIAKTPWKNFWSSPVDT
ncbi:hypothetical protein B4080_2002 [Bacillus cereus]|nr:hypothetical protein B4080_2002 [Bacillus cereus]